MVSILSRLVTADEVCAAIPFLPHPFGQHDMVHVRTMVKGLSKFQISRVSLHLRLLKRTQVLSIEAVEAVLHKLQDYHRKQLALQRIQQIFPERFQQLYAGKNRVQPFSLHEETWLDVLQEFLRCIDKADLLPINRDMIDDTYRLWLETLEPGDLDQLAQFLTFIPVQSYGFTREGNARRFPAMFLLHYLLANPYICGKLDCQLSAWRPRELSSKIPEIRFAEDVTDRLVTWTERDRQVSLLRLAHIQAEPGKWPEPIRQLPLLGCWAAHTTGNVLLDRELDWLEAHGRWPFTWDDLDWVKKLAGQARPLVEIMENRVSEWLAQDYHNRINSLARFIMNGTEGYELTW